MSENYIELKVLMRSNTTFGTSDELIRVFSDQKASEVAESTAKGYGAHVIDILRMDGTPYREDDAPAQYCPAERG